MEIKNIRILLPQLKRKAENLAYKVNRTVSQADEYQLGRPQLPITPMPKRELEERLKCWIPKNPGEIAIPNDPIAIAINGTQKMVNPHLTNREFHRMMEASSISGVLDIQGMNDAIDMAQDYLSLNHPSSRNMAAKGLEILKSNPKLKPQELKKAILREGEKGAAKPAYRVAEYLDELSREIPGFTSHQAARALSLAGRGKLNWYGWEKSLEIIRGKIKESE